MCSLRSKKILEMVYDVSDEALIKVLGKNNYASNPKYTLNDVIGNICQDMQYMNASYIELATKELQILRQYEKTHGHLTIEQIFENHLRTN